MNFGREGVQAKTEQLESKQIMRGKWAGVLSAKILLLVIVAVLVLGISFGIGAYSGILATCPDLHALMIMNLPPKKQCALSLPIPLWIKVKPEGCGSFRVHSLL